MSPTHLTLFLILAFQWGSSEAVWCEIGEALKDPNNPEVDRQCGAGCPNNYVCVQSNALAGGSVCCRSKASACSLTPAAGSTCPTPTQQCQKWYYDQARASCFPFYYNGCFGNLNNFQTKQECESLCRQAIQPQQLCPANSAAQPGTNAQTPCNMTPFMACQQGYSCQYSATMQRSYCCRTGTTQFCPAGYTAAPGTTVQSVCSSFTGCTSGYNCMQSFVGGAWYCCALTQQQQICPGGSVAAPGVTANTICQVGGPACQTGYTCQRSPINTYSYCCSSSQYNLRQDCPNAMQPYRPNGANTYSICLYNNVIQPSMCPQGTSCVLSSTINTYICCMGGGRSQGRKLVLPSLNQTQSTTTNATTN